jgi:hypothetical protein
LGDPEKIEQLPVDDWADQDLLTKDEARERLVSEIARARSRLEELRTEDSPSESETELIARRLDAMESIRDEYDIDANNT